jgi:uncharacterized protein YndB with AHSA1/START domain
VTTRSSSVLPVTATADDYTYEMQVHVPREQIIAAVTDDTLISRWWTAVTWSERDGADVRLFVRDDEPFVNFTVEHAPGTGDVTWAVTECAVEADWVGTQPSFSVQPHDDGTCTLRFHHVGLSPAVECFAQCRAGWNHFMPSLHQFLETGVGRPNEPRESRA